MSPLEGSAVELARAAMLAYQRGEMSTAEHGFRAASQQFAQNGEELQAAEAANNLCVVLLQAERPHEALECVRETPAIFEHHQNLALAAQAYGNLGSAQEGCGRLPEAEAAYLRSLDLFRSLRDSEGESLILQRLAQVQLRQGQPIGALASMQASLEAAPHRGVIQRCVRRLLSLPGRYLSG